MHAQPAMESRDVAALSPGRAAVSWGAIIAGAFVALGTTAILVELGTGLELSAMSPWMDRGAAATAFTMTGAIWMIVTQWVSACLGGYIAGRLRTRWTGTHVHEVFFRDTAHGLVTWSLATALVALVAAGSLSSLAGGGTRAAAALPSAVMNIESGSGSGANGSAGGGGASGTGATGGSQAGDSASGDEGSTRGLANADKARKSAAEVAIYTALSMLVGAFIASVSAALGGRLRDEHI